jgi:hypothetical protein
MFYGVGTPQLRLFTQSDAVLGGAIVLAHAPAPADNGAHCSWPGDSGITCSAIVRLPKQLDLSAKLQEQIEPIMHVPLFDDFAIGEAKERH